MFKRGRKYLVIIALIVSMLLHVIALAPIVWDMSWQEIIDTLREKISQLMHPETPDQVLARKKAEFVPKVSLNLDAATESDQKKSPDIITIRLIKNQPVVQPKKSSDSNKNKSNPKETVKSKANAKTSHGKATQQQADDLYTQLMAAPTPAESTSDDDQSDGTDDPTPPYDIDQNTLIDNTTVHVSPSPTPTTGTPAAASVASGTNNAKQPSNTAPPFPVEIHARYRTHIFYILPFNLDINREWHMEGRHYSIVDRASIPMYTGIMTSDGVIGSNGLEPESFQILLNNDINSFAKFNRNSMTMSYGKPNKPKQMPFNPSIQDISSIGFQMALTYSNKPQNIQVTYGNGIFPIHLELLDEEQLKLPVGIVRTLHIQGHSLSGIPATVDIWLAPDYRNMPVKVKVSSEGKTLTQSLSSLSIEGKVIFGKKYPPQDPDDDTSNSKTTNDLPQSIKQEAEF